MTNFLLGMLASIVGSIIIILCSVISRTWKKILIDCCNTMTGGDIAYIYKDKQDAESDIMKALNKGKEISIFTSRGNEFQLDTYAGIFRERKNNNKCKVRIMLPETNLHANIYDWILQREKELENFDASFKDKYLHQQIEINVKFLEPYIKEGTVELKRYNSPHIGRIICIDNTVFYTPYDKDLHGRNSRVYKYKSNGNHSKNFKRYFEQLWDSIS